MNTVPASERSTATRYFAAIMAVLVAFLARMALDPLLQARFPLITFVVAIGISGWIGGFGPAMATGILGFLAGQSFFADPPYNLRTAAAFKLVGPAYYFVSCLTMAVLSHLLHKSLATAEQSQRTLEALMENVPEGITIADAPDVTIRRVSRYGQNLIGKPRETLEGIPSSQHVQTWDIYKADGVTVARTEELPLTRATQKGEVVKNEELVMGTPDGERIPVLCNASPIRDKTGKITGGVIAWRDIRERKQAEAALRQSEATIRGFFNSSAMYMCVLELAGHDFVCVLANSKLAEFFGMSLEQMTGKRGSELGVAKETLALWVSLCQHCHASQQPITREQSVHRHGRVFWLHGTISPLPGDASGRPRFALAAVDITEHKWAELALRESEQRLKRAEAIAHLGSWELDLTSNQLTWSDEVYRIFGLQPKAFAATYEAFLDVVHPEDRAAVDAAYSGSLRDGRDSYEIEHRIVRKSDAQARFVHEKCEHLRDASGRIIRSTGMVHDITERKQAEAALQQAQAKLKTHAEELEKGIISRTAALEETIAELEHFSYAITHDMRAPLRAMQGFCELVKMTCSKCQHPHTQQYLDRIKTASDRMDRLITDSLDYSKAIRQQFALESVNLENLLNELIATYPNLHPDKADICVQSGIPAVMGNEAALTQCFSNLLGNAVKFAKPGIKPVITVRAEERSNSPQSQSPLIRIWIEDNGIGIPKGMQQAIFGLFQRATADREGTGIGLAIVRKVARRMGGEVGVFSEPDKGSRFWVDLVKADDSIKTRAQG